MEKNSLLDQTFPLIITKNHFFFSVMTPVQHRDPSMVLFASEKWRMDRDSDVFPSVRLKKTTKQKLKPQKHNETYS